MNSGAYQIHICVKKDCHIIIGALGDILFKKGNYIYTGSAMKNLSQRVARHKRKDKIIRWHIDYLLANKNVMIKKIDVFPSEQREECRRNIGILSQPGSEIPAKGFGSSDCKSCPAHLVYTK